MFSVIFVDLTWMRMLVLPWHEPRDVNVVALRPPDDLPALGDQQQVEDEVTAAEVEPIRDLFPLEHGHGFPPQEVLVHRVNGDARFDLEYQMVCSFEISWVIEMFLLRFSETVGRLKYDVREHLFT